MDNDKLYTQCFEPDTLKSSQIRALDIYVKFIFDNELTKRQKRAFTLRKNGKTFREIGIDLNVNVCVAYRHFKKAVDRLKKHIEYIKPLIEGGNIGIQKRKLR